MNIQFDANIKCEGCSVRRRGKVELELSPTEIRLSAVSTAGLHFIDFSWYCDDCVAAKKENGHAEDTTARR